MIQDTPTFWSTIFVKKGVMNSSIVLLSHKQPTVWPPLIYNITTSPGKYSAMMGSSYQILILNIDNNFNKYSKWSAGILIWFYVCNVLHWKWNHCMSSILHLSRTIGYCDDFFSSRTEVFLHIFLICCFVRDNFSFFN